MRGFLTVVAGIILIGFLVVLMVEAAQGSTLVASYYSEELRGQPTACNGEPFNPDAFTAAHPTIPCGSRLTLKHGDNETTVRINDRGPAAWTGHDIDVSEAAARDLGIKEEGSAAVEVSPSTSSGPPSSGGAPLKELPSTGPPK